ncbi:hypothetical protein AB751O23_AT_00120 [Chlamydiales bacterium SCGC AB-751-O23]|jgi:peptide chain release factor|nr:hypothetical protein AB751O23_AT_00120 [Chlamydiales bacterium SCGC AB-751-O23]
MPLSEKKILQIKEEMDTLDLKSSDLKESFSLGSGKGGQKASKSSTCVQLVHLPTKLQVTCQQERDRESNRWLAKRKLCQEFKSKILKQTSQEDEKLSKIRKQKKKKKKRSQTKHQSEEHSN